MCYTTHDSQDEDERCRAMARCRIVDADGRTEISVGPQSSYEQLAFLAMCPMYGHGVQYTFSSRGCYTGCESTAGAQAESWRLYSVQRKIRTPSALQRATETHSCTHLTEPRVQSERDGSSAQHLHRTRRRRLNNQHGWTASYTRHPSADVLRIPLWKASRKNRPIPPVPIRPAGSASPAR